MLRNRMSDEVWKSARLEATHPNAGSRPGTWQGSSGRSRTNRSPLSSEVPRLGGPPSRVATAQARPLPTVRAANDPGDPAESRRRLASPLQESLKRRYKRDYMRRWRSDPRHVAHEAAARKRDYYARKCRRVLAQLNAATREPQVPACGLCGRKNPVCEIERLVIGADALGTFTRVRVPYCGVC